MQRVREPQPPFRPRDADVEEPALLLELLGVVHGARVREDALLQPREEDRGELEPLGRVERHERDAFVRVVEGVHVSHEGDRVEERFERRVLGSPAASWAVTNSSEAATSSSMFSRRASASAVRSALRASR